jgi:hypothetical protein
MNPNLSLVNTGSVRTDVVATNYALAVLQTKLPVMPVAGEHTIGRDAAGGKRITLMRAAVVDSEDPPVNMEEGNLPSLVPENKRLVL